jgi:tetratricopeptide (TPR) repeat protein
MNDDIGVRIRNNLISKETGELLEIWQNGDVDEWDEEVFEITKEILLERLGYVPPQSIQKQVGQVLSNVDRYFEAGELEKALSECELAIQMKPDLAIAYYSRGEIYDEMGQLENAITNYQTAVRLDPEFEEAWDNLLSLEKDLEAEFQGSTVKQHLDQALEFVNKDEPERALEECELTRPTLPSIALAYNYLGMILEELEQLEPAIDAYLKAIQLNPRFYAARENLGNARVRFEEEQYLLVAAESQVERREEDETWIEWDESQVAEILETDNPIPGWLYLNEKAFLLTGWAGHRNRPGRSGYDPLETDFEEAHIEGVIFRLLITRKFRTRNPIYLLLMTYLGLLFCSPLLFVSALIHGEWTFLFPIIISSPYLIAGIALFNNVILSLLLEESEGDEDKGYTFF